MAFNLQTFKTRALTAVVFVLVMLAGLLLNRWSFFTLFSVVHFGCWLEYQKLVGLIDKEYKEISRLHRYDIMFTGWGIMLWMTDAASYRFYDISLALIGWTMMCVGVIVFALTEVLLAKKPNPRLWAHSFLGLIYISLSCAFMMGLYGNLKGLVFESYPWMLPVLLIASIWINDTMAYVVGSFIGKTPFSLISPKKTWEGTIGGAILAVLAVTLVGYYTLGFSIKSLLLISVTAAIAGTAGDLFESKLKRLAGVKDSGNIMPGHGGFLDRFDSLLVATTIVWLLFQIFY